VRKKILLLKEDNEEKELEFELEFQRSLSVEERYRMLIERMKLINQILIQYGHRKPFEIVKRK